MLTIGESYNRRKAVILDNIKVCRELIRECNKVAQKKDTNRDLALDVIAVENKCIKDFINELYVLERWRVDTKLEKDEVYGGKK